MVHILQLDRDNMIPRSLHEENIKKYDVKWTENGIDPDKSKGKNFQTQLIEFCGIQTDIQNQQSNVPANVLCH